VIASVPGHEENKMLALLYTTLRRELLQSLRAETSHWTNEMTNAIPATHFDEHAREQDGWRNGLLLIFFSRAPMNEITQFT